MRTKATLFAILISAVAAGGLLAQVACEPGPRAPRIRPVAQTPESITLQLRVERVEREISRLAKVARSLYLAHGCPGTFSELTARSAYAQGLPVRLVTGVVIVESTCRPGVDSGDAIGLMQVSPRTWHLDRALLKDPAFNLWRGTEILAGYVRRHGLREGLHHYNGMGEGCPHCDAGYADKVLLAAGLRAREERP